jgi:hypothetical protein
MWIYKGNWLWYTTIFLIWRLRTALIIQEIVFTLSGLKFKSNHTAQTWGFYSIKILCTNVKTTNYTEAPTVPLPQEFLSLYLSQTQNHKHKISFKIVKANQTEKYTILPDLQRLCAQLPGTRSPRVTKLCLVVLNTCWSLVWNLLHVSILTSRTLSWLQDFWKPVYPCYKPPKECKFR